MQDCRIAVFGTTAIATERPVYKGQRPMHQEVWRRKLYLTYSTGRLERALDLGMEVWICSIRPAFGDQDRWWLALVPPERVLCTDPSMMMDARNGLARLLEPWKRLYERFGLPWGGFADPFAARDALDGSRGVIYGGYLQGFVCGDVPQGA